jgi:tetratricopeptide (TPR) repeat protein
MPIDDLTVPEEATTGRYRLISLLRLFAHEKLGDHKNELQQLASIHYAKFAEQNSQQGNFNHLDLEWQNMMGAFKWAYENKDWKSLVQGALGLTRYELGVVGFMDARGHWREAQQLLNWALEGDSILNDPLVKATLNTNLAAFTVRLADFNAAETHLNSAQEIIGSLQDRKPQVAVQSAIVYELRSQLAERHDRQTAAAFLEQGLQKLEGIKSESATWQKGALYRRLSSTLGQLGRFDEALKTSEQALALLPTFPTPIRVGVLNILGLIYYFRREYEPAMATFQEAIPLAQSLRHLRYLANLYVNKGLVEARTGQLDLAVISQQKALTVYQHMGDVYNGSGTRINLGSLYRKLKRPEQARQHLSQAIADSKTHHLPIIEAQAFSNLAELQIQQGNIENATTSLAHADDLAEQHKLQRLQPTLIRTRAEIALANSEFKQAMALIEKALTKAEQSKDIIEEGISWRIKGLILIANQQHQAALDAWNKSATLLTRQDAFELDQTQSLMTILKKVEGKKE